jgi:hypothetical protein
MGKKSSLVTPDPYHIPGYGGYVPQFKYRIGQTFGNHTHVLLMDNTVASSGNPILTSTDVPSRFPSTPAEGYSTKKIPNLGNLKYGPDMIPGYTGYVPKSLNYFGSRYSELSECAITDFKRSTKRGDDADTTRMKPLQPSSFINPNKLTASSMKKMFSTSPHSLPDGHPEKYFISGYTGFIPKAQIYIGQGYPVITHKALIEHANSTNRLREGSTKSFVLNRPAVSTPKTYTYTKKNNGLIPHYTGHVQGMYPQHVSIMHVAFCQIYY